MIRFVILSTSIHCLKRHIYSCEELLIFSNVSQNHRKLTYDIAIYGAGPAGISLALALSNTGLRIGLFEAGGLEPPPIDLEHHPYRGQSLGRPYDVASTRLRYLGGTTNHWGGWCRPLDAYDFSVRAHIPLSGWPISRIDLNPHLETALDICEVPSGGLGLEAFEHDFGYEGFIHHSHPAYRVKNFLFSPPTRFGVRYRQDLEKADAIECYLDATLVRLMVTDGDLDKSLVMSSDGSQFHVSANFHVLAMGAIENARTLLYSEIANSSDFVGRCFSDHLGHTVGTALLDFDNRYFLQSVRNENQSLRVMPHLSFSDEALRELKLPNAGIVIDRRSSVPLNVYSTGVKNQLDWLSGTNTHKFRVLFRMENTPNTESRITLTNDLDMYGVPRIALNWQVNAFDFESVERLCAFLGSTIGLVGGRLKTDYKLVNDKHQPGSYGAHHLGTTRMSADPDYGVVDSTLRCHDVANLYVLGSSVFPTYGFANPTMTIVALSLRLASNLRQKMGVVNA